MKIESDAFKNGGQIPGRFTCDGEGINPQLIFRDVPKKTRSLALIVDDPDIPDAAKQSYDIEIWDHWIVWNISPNTKEIKENSIPEGAMVGKSTRGVNAYTPPCPPDGLHRYFFKLYALDTILNIPKTSKAEDLSKAMQGHILVKAELMGKYQRE